MKLKVRLAKICLALLGKEAAKEAQYPYKYFYPDPYSPTGRALIEIVRALEWGFAQEAFQKAFAIVPNVNAAKELRENRGKN